MNARQFLEQLVETKVLVLDGECVDHVGMYEDVLQELAALVGVKLIAFSGAEGARRSVTMTLEGLEPITFEAEGNTDWLDSGAVVEAFNRALGKTRRLVEFHFDDFGQASGWAVLDAAQWKHFVEFAREDGGVSLTLADGRRVAPASEDRGGDPEEWEALILETSVT